MLCASCRLMLGLISIIGIRWLQNFGLSVAFLVLIGLLYNVILPRVKLPVKKENALSNRSLFIIAHRGGSAEVPENTLYAFKHAASIPVDVLELDVRMTFDNQIVVCHDKNLNRITGNDVDVEQIAYNEVPSLLDSQSLKPPNSADNASFKKSFGKQKLCLFSEVLQHFPDTLLLVDIKTHTEKAVIETVKLVHAYKAEKDVIFAGFSQFVMNTVHQLDPSLFISIGPRRLIFLFSMYLLNLLPLVPIHESFFAVPLSDFYFEDVYKVKYQMLKKLLPEMLSRILAKAYQKIQRYVLHNSGFFSKLQELGIRCVGWMCHTESELRIATQLHLEGFVTDYPSTFKTTHSNFQETLKLK